MKYIIIILVVLASFGLIWSVVSFINPSKTGNKVSGSAEDFTKAVESETSDKCQTPSDYTNEEWMTHMSHHPDRYRECLTNSLIRQTLTYQNINPQELEQMLKAKDFSLIDVHIPEQSHIPSTDMLIPYNEISSSLDKLPQDKNASIVLYCKSGSMSKVASDELIKMGYSNVYNLEGGLNAWQNEGYNVDNSPLNQTNNDK